MFSRLIITPLLLTLAGHAAAVGKLKPDGLWRGNAAAALSAASGNTNSESLNLSVDAARRTADDKLSLSAEFIESRSETTTDGVTTSETTAYQATVSDRYDRDLTERVFGFGGLEFSHDQIKLLALRSVVSTGLGYHLIQSEDNQWDVLGGLSHRTDRYLDPGVLVGDAMQTRLVAPEMLVGEESSHRLTDSTRLRQKLTVHQGIGDIKGTRAAMDLGLQVALNKTMSLSVKLQRRYDSEAQAPTKAIDTLLFTGINVSFGG